MRSVEIFASTWNMGGVDRESCAVGTGGTEEEQGRAAKSALQLVIPFWLPLGYDLMYARASYALCSIPSLFASIPSTDVASPLTNESSIR